MLPVSLALGGTFPLIVSGQAGVHDYALEMKGNADCNRLLNFLQTLGLPPPDALTTIHPGEARVDLRTSGRWQGFAVPITTGSLRLLPSSPARAAMK